MLRKSAVNILRPLATVAICALAVELSLDDLPVYALFLADLLVRVRSSFSVAIRFIRSPLRARTFIRLAGAIGDGSLHRDKRMLAGGAVSGPY